MTKKATKKTSKKSAKKAPSKKATKKASAKKTATKKASAKKGAVKKTAAKKTATKKAVKKAAKKSTARGAKKAAKKATARKTGAAKQKRRASAPPKAPAKKRIVKAPTAPLNAPPLRIVNGKPQPRVNNPPLSARQRKEMLAMLEAERDRVLAILQELDEKSLYQTNSDREQDRSSYSIHQADYASDNQSLNIALLQRQIESRRLEEVEYALKRVNSRNFGKCRQCTANIGYDRLQAKPSAELCIVCRSELDPRRQ